MSGFQWKRQTEHHLRFPGEDTWETWTGAAGQPLQLTTDAPPSTGGMTAIETLAFDSSPFWLLVNEGHADAADAVSLRWESLGLASEGQAKPWVHWTVVKAGKRMLIATVALNGESTLSDWRRLSPEWFEPSACLLPLPPNAITVWKELGRFVAAFTRSGKLLHASTLTSRSLDADAAFELRDLHAALQAHGFADDAETVHVWTHSEPDFAPQLACLFEAAEIIKGQRPAPVLPDQPSGMLPAEMVHIRQQKQQRRQKVLLMAAAAMIYVAFFGAWWASLRLRETRLLRHETALAAAQPEIDSVRETQQQWMDVEPAINPDLYPVELFHQVVSLLPDEGIRLKEFQVNADRVVISGEAASVNLATMFRDKLVACVPLQRYTWSVPQPRIRDEDNRAEFNAQGTLTGGAPGHEGQ
ncbi:hypothetical protein [Prosthecobacter sp.]|uniref:hypothetical protein n=1 Tax=Prosthecobacter sp. TaxID=1965333 RepID=UPI0037833EE2